MKPRIGDRVYLDVPGAMIPCIVMGYMHNTDFYRVLDLHTGTEYNAHWHKLRPRTGSVIGGEK